MHCRGAWSEAGKPPNNRDRGTQTLEIREQVCFVSSWKITGKAGCHRMFPSYSNLDAFVCVCACTNATLISSAEIASPNSARLSRSRGARWASCVRSSLPVSTSPWRRHFILRTVQSGYQTIWSVRGRSPWSSVLTDLSCSVIGWGRPQETWPWCKWLADNKPEKFTCNGKGRETRALLRKEFS